jgi:hypothetical protein
MNVDRVERIVKCVCLLHNTITGLEGTTHEPSVHCSHQRITDVSGRSFTQSQKGAMDIRNAFKAYFNEPTGAIPSQNQYLS